MNRHQQFLKDLAFGVSFEKKASELLKEYDKSITKLIFNHDSKFDIKDNNGVTYEVKADRRAKISNNFFIEFGKIIKDEPCLELTGISVSEANFYILTDTTNFFLIPTFLLKLLISSIYKRDVKQLKTAPFTVGYLVPYYDIHEHSIKLNNLNSNSESDNDEDI